MPVMVTPRSAEVPSGTVAVTVWENSEVPVASVAVAVRNWPLGTPPGGLNVKLTTPSACRHVLRAEERLP